MLLTFGSNGATATFYTFRRVWPWVRMVLLAMSTVAALAVGDLRRNWYIPLISAAGAMVPAAGVPVAGGILFVPILVYAGTAPADAIAFATAAQSLGVGVLTPLNCYMVEASPIRWKFFTLYLPFAICGSVTVVLMPMCTVHRDHVLLIVFCIVCAITFVHSASQEFSKASADDIASYPTPSRAFSCATVAIHAAVAMVSGSLTGFIGIGIEKISFTMLRAMHGLSYHEASLVGTTLNGTLSMISTFLHATGFMPGNVAFTTWLAAVPGLVLGSMTGSWVRTVATPSTLVRIFLAMLVIEIVVTMRKVLSGWYIEPSLSCTT